MPAGREVCLQQACLACRIAKVSAKDGKRNSQTTRCAVRDPGRLDFTSHQRELLREQRCFRLDISPAILYKACRSIGKSNGLFHFHCLLRPPCRPLPATGTPPPPARQRWPLAQAAPAAWRGTAGVGAAGGLSNAEEGGLMQTRNAKGGRPAMSLAQICWSLEPGI